MRRGSGQARSCPALLRRARPSWRRDPSRTDGEGCARIADCGGDCPAGAPRARRSRKGRGRSRAQAGWCSLRMTSPSSSWNVGLTCLVFLHQAPDQVRRAIVALDPPRPSPFVRRSPSSPSPLRQEQPTCAPGGRCGPGPQSPIVRPRCLGAKPPRRTTQRMQEAGQPRGSHELAAACPPEAQLSRGAGAKEPAAEGP